MTSKSDIDLFHTDSGINHTSQPRVITMIMMLMLMMMMMMMMMM